MKRINKVVTPPTFINRHIAVVAKKHAGTVKVTLEALEAAVSARYTTYNLAFDNDLLHTVTEDPALQINNAELQSCYKKSTKPLRDIFKAINNAQTDRSLQKCPYCGITKPNTHDHYLPEGRFPEFSVHALNLIPCCSSCNSTKNERWLDGNNRAFINYYLDPLPDDEYLHVRVQTTPGSLAIGAIFSLIRPQNINDDRLWALIESHYTKLGLLDRYKDEVNNEVSEVYDTCRSHIQDGGNNVVNFLSIMSDRFANVFGVNHWRVVLWRALALDQNFINLVNQAAL